jgi:hypothetical protein
MLYEEVFRKLADASVKYSVAGGVALVLHGVVRLTADIDLIVEMSTENLQKFIAAMNELGYKPKPPVKAEDFINPLNRKAWKEEKGMEVFSFFHPAKPMNLVDIFINEPISFDEIEREIVIFKARDIKIPVISKNHLIFLKSKAHRPQDIADIEALEALEQMGIKNEKHP